MKQTWEQNRPIEGNVYRVRLFEDLKGDRSPVFVAEAKSGQPMGGEEARMVHQNLAMSAGVQPEECKLWEQRPDGQLYELSYSNRQSDVNPLQNDLDANEYSREVSSGRIKPQMVESTDLDRQEISQSDAQRVTGQKILSYEQEHNQDFEQLNHRWEP